MKRALILCCVLFAAFLLVKTLTESQRETVTTTSLAGVMELSGDSASPVREEMTRSVEEITPTAGSIQLVFVSETDEPVPGVKALLMEEGTGPNPSFSEESDEDGFIEWQELGPGTYRWLLLSDHTYWPDDTATGERPPKRSDPIVLVAGETKRFPITLFGGTVTGKLHLTGPLETRAIVKVFNVQNGDESQEGTTRTLDGFFRFSSISSGKKILSAVARLEGQHFYFYRRRFDIEPGGNVDLGTIFPREGADSDGMIVFDHDGTQLETGTVYAVPSSLDAILQILNRSARDPNELMLQQVFDVTVGESFHLHGLPQGEWLLNASFGYYKAPGSKQWDFWPSPRPGYRVKADRVEIIDVPFTGLRIPFMVTASVPVTIRVRYPDGETPFRTTVVLYSAARESEEIRIRAPRSGNEAIQELELPIGQYQVLAHPDPLFVESENLWYSMTRADIHGRKGEILITFQKGTCIRGQVTGSRKSRTLGVSFSGWDDQNGNPIFVYKVVPDENGMFILPGLPPSTELLFAGGQGFVPTRSGAAGKVTQFTLSAN